MYRVWQTMVQRCTKPKALGFANYGGRGITVCERWMTFENFLADMGERPKGMTLERRDNDGNYEPGNVRWATMKEQAHNTRTTRLNECSAALIRHMRRRGASHRDLGHAFGVSHTVVAAVIAYRSW